MDNFENENNIPQVENDPKEESISEETFAGVTEPAEALTPETEPAVTIAEEAPLEETFEKADDIAVNDPTSAPAYASGDDLSQRGVYGFNSHEKIEFNNETDDNSKKSSSKGLRVFAGILALVLLLTVSCAVAYNMGKKKSENKKLYTETSMKVYPKPANTDEMTAQEVYDKINDSIVGIIAYNEDGNASQATGIVYTDNEYILTNDHIYSNVPAAKFKIYTSKGEVFDAEYVAGDTISDIALLKVKDATGLPAPQFGDSNELQFGENVVAIGRPGDARSASSISTGIISNPFRRAQVTSSYSVRMIQTDCDIFEGSSGGALVNMYGQVVGMTSSKTTADGGASMSFAIPVKTIARFAPQLSSKGRVVDRAKLGITYSEITSLEAEINGTGYTGLYVTNISEDSDLYGKIEKGCIITKVNGTDITNSNVILDVIDDSRANDTLKLTVVDKDGNVDEYSIKLKANVGESSYSTEKKEVENMPSGNQGDDEKGKDFNFPKGE